MKRFILLSALLIGASPSAPLFAQAPGSGRGERAGIPCHYGGAASGAGYQRGHCHLDGLVNATIAARVSGHIISQNYREGSVEKKGDVLFQIDPRPFQDALAQARAFLARAQATQLKAEQDEKRELENRVISGAQERDSALQADATAKADIEADQAADLAAAPPDTGASTSSERPNIRKKKERANEPR